MATLEEMESLADSVLEEGFPPIWVPADMQRRMLSLLQLATFVKELIGRIRSTEKAASA